MTSRRDLYAMGEPFGEGATRKRPFGRVYGSGDGGGGGGGGSSEPDYGGYSGGGYEAGYEGASPDYSGGDSLGTGLSIGGGNLGLNAGNLDISGGIGADLAGLGPVGSVGGDYSFDAPGGLGLTSGGGLGLSPEGSYGLQGTFEDIGPGPLADYSIAGPSTSTAELGSTSGWDNIMGVFDKLSKNPIAMMALSKAIPGLAPIMGMVNLARASQTPQGAARGFGGLFGSTVGGALAGAPGAVLGGLAGQYAGSKSEGLPGYAGARDSAAPEGGTGMDLGGIAGGLAGLYSANQASKAYGQQASVLGDLYGQNSPYAQALRQQLERKDAAAGRRSQYGPREVELQARLAQMYSQNAPATLQAQQAAQAQKNARLNTLLGLGKATGAFDWASRGLRDIFSSPVDMTGFQTPMEAPSYSNFAAENYAPSNFGELGTGTFGGNDFFLNY